MVFIQFKVINSMLYQIQRSELYLTGGRVRADDLLVHASAAHKHKMLCFKFCRHVMPNLYWPNFTSDLCSKPQHNIYET